MMAGWFELLTSRDPPASASQSVGITGVSHCTWPLLSFNSIIYIYTHTHKYVHILNSAVFINTESELEFLSSHMELTYAVI